jgi:hypothetical protein
MRGADGGAAKEELKQMEETKYTAPPSKTLLPYEKVFEVNTEFHS